MFLLLHPRTLTLASRKYTYKFLWYSRQFPLRLPSILCFKNCAQRVNVNAACVYSLACPCDGQIGRLCDGWGAQPPLPGWMPFLPSLLLNALEERFATFALWCACVGNKFCNKKKFHKPFYGKFFQVSHSNSNDPGVRVSPPLEPVCQLIERLWQQQRHACSANQKRLQLDCVAVHVGGILHYWGTQKWRTYSGMHTCTDFELWANA